MPQPTPVHSPWISRTHLAALATATVLAGAVAAIGILASFHTVSTQMQPGFKGWAWAVPVTLDASIASFSILELVLLRIALPHALARLAVYAATAATVYLNTRSPTLKADHAQLVAHASMPAVWALYIELLRSGAATLTRRERHHPEHPALALLLAPWPVLTAWRRDILGHATSAQPREEKMSTGCGHFPHPDQQVRAEREGPDIFSALLDRQAGAVTSAHDALKSSDGRVPAERNPRIGKGRGLTGRHAVLDLAHRNPQLTAAQIAERLNLTPRTVRRHLGRQ